MKRARKPKASGRRLTLLRRVAVHWILVAGAVVFLFPFVWLVTTSVKPIEQTMKMPPEWVPRAHYAPVQGERLKVLLEREFKPTAYVVRLEAGPWRGETETVAVSALGEGEGAVAFRALRLAAEGGAGRAGRAVVRIAEGPWEGKCLSVPAGMPEDGVVEVDGGVEECAEPASAQGPGGAEAERVTLRIPVTKVKDVFEPFAIVRIEEGKRRGERVLLPASKFVAGKAEVEVRVADQTVTRHPSATLEKEVTQGDWLVREKQELLPQEKGPATFEEDDIRSWRALCFQVLEQRRQGHKTPGGRLAARLSADTLSALGECGPGASLRIRHREAVVRAMNGLIETQDLYDEAWFAAARVQGEAKEFLRRPREALSNDELRRLNRLLLETAFPEAIARTQGRRLEPRWDCVAASAIEEKVEPAWHNYQGAIRYTGYHEFSVLGKTVRVPMFLVYVYNTLVVAVLGMIGIVLSSALAAYGFARIKWRARETCFLITLSTMMIPFAVTMIPLYGIFRALGWIGTLKPLWVPAFFGHAFSIFLLRQFFRTIPQDLSDAARIDGCSEFGIFWRIILPLSKPALAVVALFHFMYAWRDFMAPLIYLTRKETFTLSLGLYSYQSQHGGSEWHYLMAASTLMILPIIVLFFFTQRTFIQGISTTGMKG